MTLQAEVCTCDDSFPSFAPCAVHGELGKDEWERLRARADVATRLEGAVKQHRNATLTRLTAIGPAARMMKSDKSLYREVI